jgi:uncharacterized protein YjbI with pentapeptide repeats
MSSLSSGIQVTTVPERCLIEMYCGAVCERPIHPAPNHDKTPICLMHSHDPEKSDAKFQNEIESILRIAEAQQDGQADFSGFVFPSANYSRRQFVPGCMFRGAKFTQDADFGGSEFRRDINFDGARFEQTAHFVATKFEQHADFANASFVKFACFNQAIFSRWANFFNVTFTEVVVFNWSKFHERVDFGRARFLLGAEFRETEFRQDESRLPGPVFSLAEFSEHTAVLLYKTYLGQALLHDCDISKLVFSSVEWRLRKQGSKRMVFEEVVDIDRIDPEIAWALRSKSEVPGERDYNLIAELYRQLKKNYDDRDNFPTAGDFHYGELEMRRLSSSQRNRVMKWLHRHLGLVALYKYGSEYGESYLRPFIFLLVVITAFTLLFPLAGLVASADASQQGVSPAKLSYSHFASFVNLYPERKWVGIVAFFGRSLMTALSIAGFQKELKYEPSYPWGRALALLEFLLTSTFVALLLLAIRRQFKR